MPEHSTRSAETRPSADTTGEAETLKRLPSQQDRPVSEFVLAVPVGADETLADRTRFGLDADQWKALLEALDAPPRELPRLSRLLQEPSVFERGN